MINKFVSRFLMFFKQCGFLYGSRSKIQCNKHMPNVRFIALQRRKRTQLKLVRWNFTNQVLWISVNITGLMLDERSSSLRSSTGRKRPLRYYLRAGYFEGHCPLCEIWLATLVNTIKSASWVFDMRIGHRDSRPWTQNSSIHARTIYVGNKLKY